MRRDTMAQHDWNHFSGHQGSQSFPVSSRKRPVTCCVLCVFSQTEQKKSLLKKNPKNSRHALVLSFLKHALTRYQQQHGAGFSSIKQKVIPILLLHWKNKSAKLRCWTFILSYLHKFKLPNYFWYGWSQKARVKSIKKYFNSLFQLARWELTVCRLYICLIKW